MPIRAALLTATATLALGLGACSSGPKYTIADNVLAQVDVNEKQGILAAQSEQNVARQEYDKAKADLSQGEKELDIAENEYKQAKLTLENAETGYKLAEQTGDVNRKSAAQRDIEVAKMGKKAAQAKVDWLEKKRKWLKALRDSAESHSNSASAKVELEKARLASAKGIKPSNDFNVGNFELESSKKDQAWQQARLDADKLKVDVDGLERQYTLLSDQYKNAPRPQ